MGKAYRSMEKHLNCPHLRGIVLPWQVNQYCRIFRRAHYIQLCVGRCKFFSLTETPEDYTLMLDEEGFKGKV